MKKILLAAALLIISVAGAHAQTPTVAPNTPIRIGWDYNTGTGVKFSILVDKQIVKNFTSSELTIGPMSPTGIFAYEATMPGIAPGLNRVLVLRAYIGDSPTDLFADSAPLTVNVLPSAPTGLRIILTPTAGGVQIELRGAPVDGSTPTTVSVLQFPTIEK